MQSIIPITRSWLTDLRRPTGAPNRQSRLARRLLRPELLENRYAPTGMIPLELMAALVSDESERIDSLDDKSPRTEIRAYYRRDASWTAPEWHNSIPDSLAVLHESEPDHQQAQKHADASRQMTEFRTPDEIAAINSVFESFKPRDIGILTWVGELVPPPVIQPVEPLDSQPRPELGLEPVETLLPTPGKIIGGEALVSESSGNLPNDTLPGNLSGTENLAENLTGDPVSTDGVQGPAEIPPPVIQPVIMDPESEHNQPSPPVDDIETRD